MPCPQRDLRVRLNDLLRDKVEAPMLGDSCQQQYAFHPCEPLADTHTRTATEWKVCESGTFLFGLRCKTLRVKTFGLGKITRIAMHHIRTHQANGALRHFVVIDTGVALHRAPDRPRGGV